MPEFKPCPFCGNTKFDITPDITFYELQVESGSASVRMTCHECNADMWEHSWGEHDYYKRVHMLANKWNRRVNRDQ